MAGASVIVRVPWQGEDLTSAPPQAPTAKGSFIQNFLPGRPGKLILRGPVTSGDATITPNTSQPGYWLSPTAPSGYGTNHLLFIRSNGQLQDLHPTAILSGAAYAAPALLVQMSRNHTILGAMTYGIGKDTNGVPLKLWRWDGVAATVNVVPMNNGPTGATLLDVATFQSRVVALGGVKPGGGGGTDRSLYWTDPGWDGTDTVAKWSDDVSGLVNEIDLDEPGHILQYFNGALYILGTTGIQVLRGSAPSNWTVRKVSSVGAHYPLGLGVPTTKAAVTTDEGIYYAAASSVYLFDGVQSIDIGQDVRELFTILNNLTAFNTAEFVILDTEWLSITVPLADRWLLYNRKQRFWCEATSGVLTNGVPKFQASTFSTLGPVGMDDTHAISMGLIGSPDMAPAVITAFAITNGRDHTITTNADIIATATSRLIELGTPRSKSALHRLCADLVLQSPAVSSQPAWTVSVLDEDGTVRGTATGISTTTAQRQRIVLDLFGECDSVQVKWDIDANSQVIYAAEIHDASLEFTPGRDRTG